MNENDGIQMNPSSSHIPIAQPVSSDEIQLGGQITSIDEVDKVEAPEKSIDNGAHLGRNDDDYCTICCCFLCAYTEISCPEKQTDCCKLSCCSCSIICMEGDCWGGRRGGNTFIFFYYDGNNHNNHNSCCNDNCCCCFNCGDCINNMINACSNIPCSCECCHALPNLNIFDHNICEVVSAVFRVVYDVINFVLTLFGD
jgi:hypothetical protein